MPLLEFEAQHPLERLENLERNGAVSPSNARRIFPRLASSTDRSRIDDLSEAGGAEGFLRIFVGQRDVAPFDLDYRPLSPR